MSRLRIKQGCSELITIFLSHLDQSSSSSQTETSAIGPGFAGRCFLLRWWWRGVVLTATAPRASQQCTRRARASSLLPMSRSSVLAVERFESPSFFFSFLSYSCKRFWADGAVLRDEAWVNLALQSRLPLLRHSAFFLMTFCSSRAWSFGSSLRIVCRAKDVRIPIYRVADHMRCMSVVVSMQGATEAVFVLGETVLACASRRALRDGWVEMEYELPPSASGDRALYVSFLSANSELHLGKMSFLKRSSVQFVSVRVTKSFSRPGRSKSLICWNAPNAEFEVVDVLRNGEIVARLLPTAEGSFFDEEDQPDHDLVEYAVRTQ